MTGLVAELVKEHKAIFEALEEAKAAGIGSREGQKKLLSVKSLLSSHLKKEDERLYPALIKAAESNLSLRHTIEVFAKEQQEVTEAVTHFLNIYSQGGSPMDFAAEYGKVYATLRMRMSREENSLYREYERISKEERLSKAGNF